jgi:hypothetical protein
MDWRRAADYDWCVGLTAVEWAWQFLRRNPEYHLDYAWFMATWRALEADYGAPPQRDFFRWRQDPRAWRDEAVSGHCGAEGCAAEDNKVLIECWMGAKWGLRKFPLDPALARPVPGEELDWREQVLESPIVDVAAQDYLQQRQGKIALGFDLALPLEAQLTQARRLLIIERRGLDRAGSLPPRTVSSGRQAWILYLRLLDGVEAGADSNELAVSLNVAGVDTILASARAMAHAGYRRILLLET